jgi:flagellar protein FliO/FliZ
LFTVYSQEDSALETGSTEAGATDRVEGGATGAADDFRQSERGLVFTDAADTAPPSNGASTIFALIRILLVLAVMAAVFYGILYLIKKTKKANQGDDAHLKVLARMPVSAQTSVAVVSVGRKAWLVGVSSSSVNLIAEIDDQVTVDSMELSYRTETPGGATPLTFKKLLEKFAGTFNTKPNAGKTGNNFDYEAAERLREKRNKLQGL